MVDAHRMPRFAQGLPKTRAAIIYAEQMHAGQRRRVDGAAFIVHPLEVASLLYDAGASDDVVAAGALHDVIEQTNAAAIDLRERFGQRITALVLAVSEDERIRDYAARKSALRDQVAAAGAPALLVFAADKVAKVRELRLDASHPRAVRPATAATPSRALRVMHYQSCLRMLEDLLPDASLVKQLRTELQCCQSGVGYPTRASVQSAAAN